MKLRCWVKDCDCTGTTDLPSHAATHGPLKFTADEQDGGVVFNFSIVPMICCAHCGKAWKQLEHKENDDKSNPS